MSYQVAYQRWTEAGFEKNFDRSTVALDLIKSHFASLHDYTNKELAALTAEQRSAREHELQLWRDQSVAIGQYRGQLMGELNRLRRLELKGELK